MWIEAYKLSPTISPAVSVSNPMPRMSNPDPHNYIMQVAASRAESEVEGKMNVASLLAGSEKKG